LNHPSLNRVLTAKDTLALAFGAMIGWGWVVLTGDWITIAGSLGAILAFGVGGLMVTLIGLTYAELASAMPEVGGEHAYSYRALGAGASFICTWAIVLGYVSVVAFEAVALPTVIEYLLPGFKKIQLWNVGDERVYLSWVLVGSMGAATMTWLNVRGMRASALLQQTVTACILVSGVMLLLGAVNTGAPSNMEPLLSTDSKGVLMVLIMTPFMFVGFDVIPQAAAELNIPFKQIGRLLLASVLLAVIWYVAMISGVALVLPNQQLNGSNLPTAEAMQVAFGSPIAGEVLIIVGIGGIITSWNAFLIGGSRAVYAMALAKMLPDFLTKLHPVYKTPVNAILMIGTVSFFAPLFGKNAMTWLVNAGGLGIVLAYALVAISFLVLRKREPDMPRPFKVPQGSIVGLTAVALSAGMCALYLPGSPAALLWPYEWALILFWSGAGVALYIKYVKRK
jgi:amino acid transporter